MTDPPNVRVDDRSVLDPVPAVSAEAARQPQANERARGVALDARARRNVTIAGVVGAAVGAMIALLWPAHHAGRSRANVARR